MNIQALNAKLFGTVADPDIHDPTRDGKPGIAGSCIKWPATGISAEHLQAAEWYESPWNGPSCRAKWIHEAVQAVGLKWA